MDFAFTADERAFAEEVRRFLREHPLERFPLEGMDAGYGSGAHSRAFMRALGAQGWLTHGLAAGRTAARSGRCSSSSCCWKSWRWPARPFGPLAGCWQTADAIIAYGSERLRREVAAGGRARRRHVLAGLQRARRGLRSARTQDAGAARRRRVRDHAATRSGRATPASPSYGLVFARTSQEARRAAAASACSWCPTARPGMDIRPIRSLTGEVYHYEVFLDDVRVPADMRLGPEGEGFVALLNGLDSDRFWGRFYKAPALERMLRQLVEYANTTLVRGVPLARDPRDPPPPGRRRRWIAALRALFYRAACLMRDEATITYETAVAKVMADELGQKVAPARHGPARPVGTAARGLARGEARRPDLAPAT